MIGAVGRFEVVAENERHQTSEARVNPVASYPGGAEQLNKFIIGSNIRYHGEC